VFHVLVLGDFSGTFSRNRQAPKLKPQFIDRDNFDDVLKAMNVTLDIQGKKLTFRELDDFDPDCLCEKFALLDDHEDIAALPPADLLSAIIGEQDDEEDDEPERPITAKDAANLSAFVQRVTAPHVIPAKNPAQLKRESDRFAMAAERLRAILHDPTFQSIEAAWRALYLLVRGVDTGPDLKIYILDITLPELVMHSDALRDTLKKMDPWALLAGNFAFGQTDAEVRALRKIAGLCDALRAPFVAEAVPADTSPAWTEFRKSPEAKWIGLALPQFLLRLPYGKNTSPIESFPFEEMPESKHLDYLWGNPAFLCASLLAQAFESSGWDMDSIPRRVEDLPLHIYYEDGEPIAKPCAEVLLSHSEAEYLMERGVMPVVSIKGQDAAVLLRFQSVADPLQPLPRFHPTAD